MWQKKCSGSGFSHTASQSDSRERRWHHNGITWASQLNEIDEWCVVLTSFWRQIEMDTIFSAFCGRATSFQINRRSSISLFRPSTIADVLNFETYHYFASAVHLRTADSTFDFCFWETESDEYQRGGKAGSMWMNETLTTTHTSVSAKDLVRISSHSKCCSWCSSVTNWVLINNFSTILFECCSAFGPMFV